MKEVDLLLVWRWRRTSCWVWSNWAANRIWWTLVQSFVGSRNNATAKGASSLRKTQSLVFRFNSFRSKLIELNQSPQFDTIKLITQAIAAYAESIGTQPINMKVTVNAEEFSAGFQMTESDRLVQRRIDLPSPLASSVEIDSVGEGEGCAIIQVRFYYFCILLLHQHLVIKAILTRSIHLYSRLCVTTCTGRHLARHSSWMSLISSWLKARVAEVDVSKFALDTQHRAMHHQHRPTWS